MRIKISNLIETPVNENDELVFVAKHENQWYQARMVLYGIDKYKATVGLELGDKIQDISFYEESVEFYSNHKIIPLKLYCDTSH